MLCVVCGVSMCMSVCGCVGMCVCVCVLGVSLFQGEPVNGWV